jgi:CHAD domain-containing protein
VSEVVSAKVSVSLAYGQRSDAASATVLRRLLDTFHANLEGALAGEDPEYLHQLRISVRRSRTVQRQLAAVFPAVELPGFRTEFRWLQRATGEARDADVHLEEFDFMQALLPESMRGDLDVLRPVLTHWRLAALGQTARALRSRRAADLLADWERLLEVLPERALEDRPAAAKPIGMVAGRRIWRAYRRVVTLGRAIDDTSPAADYHELRKKGKELRYLLELFGTQLFGSEIVDPLVKSLKDLQDVLGRHQDREVQIAFLQSLAAEVATLRGGPEALLAMGVLIDRLHVDELEARAEFGERFAAFAEPEQRHHVKATFNLPDV